MKELPWQVKHAIHLAHQGYETYVRPAASVMCFLYVAGSALSLIADFTAQHGQVAYAQGTTPTPNSDVDVYLPYMRNVDPTSTYTPTPTYTPGGPTLTATLRPTREWTWTPAFVGTETPLAPMPTPTLTPTIAPGQ